MSRRRRGGYGAPDPDGFNNGTEMVLKIGDIQGDSDLPGHEGWIPILAWSWGMSRYVADYVKPKRIRDALESKRNEILKKAGLEDKADEEDNSKDESPAPSYRRRRGRRGQGQGASKKSDLDVLEALDELNSEDEAFQFEDEEVKPRRQNPPNLQELSLTKYCDLTSPDIYLRLLGQKKGVDVMLRICKTRDLPDDSKELENSNEKGKDDADSTSASTETEAEAPKKLQVLVMQEFLFTDAFITSVSTGGSGGEDRLTENITINFGNFQYRLKDYSGTSALEVESGAAKIKTKAIHFDGARQKVGPLDEAVKKTLRMQQQLDDVQGIVMGYIQ